MYPSLLPYLDLPQINCLNGTDAHALKSIVASQPINNSKTAWLLNNADKQLLINFFFKETVEVSHIVIRTILEDVRPNLQGPRGVKIFINNPSKDIENAETAEEPEAAQILILSSEDVKVGNPIALHAARFQAVNSLHIFVATNQAGEGETRIDAIDILGYPVNSSNDQATLTSQPQSDPGTSDEDKKDIDEGTSQLIIEVPSPPLHRPDLTMHLNDIGNSFFQRFQQFGDTKDLDEAISRYREAIRVTPPDHPFLASLHNNLGGSFLMQYDQFGNVQDLDESISQFLQAVQSVPQGHSELHNFLGNLGVAILRRFERFDDLKDVDESISHLLESIRITPSGHPELPGRLNNLGYSFLMRFDRLGDVKDTEESISQLLQAVRITPEDDADLHGYLDNLGNSYSARFDRFGVLKDIEEAISRHLEAVRVVPPGHPDLPSCLFDLGKSFSKRYERLGDVKDIENGILQLREAVRNTPLGHPLLPFRLNFLGRSLAARFKRFGNVKDIDDSISQQLEALRISPVDHPDRRGHLNNLANSYKARFEQFHDTKDLDNAISQLVDAVSATPEDHPDLPGHLNNLASSFLIRFRLREDVKDLDEAISQLVKAVHITPMGHFVLSSVLSNLGNSFVTRFMRFGDTKDIDEAILRHLEAVRATPPDHPNLSPLLINIANSYFRRFEWLGDAKDMDEAISNQLEGARRTPPDHPDLPGCLGNLGNFYLSRFKKLGDMKDIDQARRQYQAASMITNGFPYDRYLALSQLAGLLHYTKDIERALEAYKAAINLLPVVMWIGLDVSAQLKQLPERSQNLPCDAMACAIELAQQHPDRRQSLLEQGIELLDQGRSVMWSQASHLRADLTDLRVKHPALAEKVNYHARALNQSSFRDSSQSSITEQEAQRFRRTAEEYTNVVAEVRALPGFQQFLLPPPFADLADAATSGPIVIVNTSQYRCDIIIIKHDKQILHLPLESVSLCDITSLEEKFSTEVTLFENGEPNQSTEHLEWLWDKIGNVVVKCLELNSAAKQLPRIWWCLTGPLTFVPIHTCLPKPSPRGARKPGMMETVVSSYTPTISSLLRARQRPSASSISMLAVAQPDGGFNGSALPCTTMEINILDQLPVSCNVLINDKATVQSVATALQNCTWAHIACHAFQDPHSPTDSGFALHDGQLSVSRMSQRELGRAEFAFLSACQSAAGSKTLPGESVHISAALQFAGFRSVIGTMWSINDMDGPLITERFYNGLFYPGARLPIAEDTAYALHHAILELRQNGSISLMRSAQFIHYGV